MVAKKTQIKPLKKKNFSKGDIITLIRKSIKNATSVNIESIKLGGTEYMGSSLKNIKISYKTK